MLKKLFGFDSTKTTVRTEIVAGFCWQTANSKWWFSAIDIIRAINKEDEYIDWSKINKNDYLQAMQTSVVNASPIHTLLASALTDKINDRETFMKGIDYSYYYEQED